MKKLKIALLGAGHLGRIHMKCLLATDCWQVVGFFDPDEANASKAITDFQVPRFKNLEKLLAEVDAVDIVTPTTTHFKLAKKCLLVGKHVFLEKPATQTVAEGKRLLKLEEQTGLKVQVGHVERFNPAFLGVKDLGLRPMFIEGHRLAAFQPRGTDVSVVLDLMIHDLDLVLHLIKSPIRRVSGSGVAVLSHTPDIANARIEFKNGAVANLIASRISMKAMRKLRIFQPDAYLSLDFFEKTAQTVRLFRPDAPDLPPLDNLMEFETSAGKKWLQLGMPEVASVNAIQMELETFARSILENSTPVVTLADGVAALELAHRVLREIEKQPIVPNAE